MYPKNLNQLDDYEKQFYDEQGNILPEWEYPFVLWENPYSYYPDGNPRPQYREQVFNSGRSIAGIAYVLEGKKREVQEWRETEELWQKNYGISYTEQIRESHRRQLQEIRESF